jgi:hypothetical protein
MESSMAVQRHSARVHRFVTVSWAICLVLVVLERFSAAAIHAFASNFSNDAMVALLGQVIVAMPEALFLVALWWVRAAIGSVARGELFGAAVTCMLGRVGVMLVCAAAVRLFIVPMSFIAIGRSMGHWIAFDAEAIVLAAIGIAFRSIAGVLRHASAIQSELDEIF